MNRRLLLRALGTGVLGIAAGCNFSLEDGILNPCLPGPMPKRRSGRAHDHRSLRIARGEYRHDQGPNGPLWENFELFERLMDEARYERQLFGEISALTQANREESVVGGQQFTTVVFESRRVFESKPIA